MGYDICMYNSVLWKRAGSASSHGTYICSFREHVPRHIFCVRGTRKAIVE